jgi:hypothetical protein
MVSEVKNVDAKIQTGDKITSAAYKRGMLAYDYLVKAMQQDTKIKGGLILSALIQLGLFNDAGELQVRSGINGVDIEGDKSVYLWAGGTLQQAIEFLKQKEGQEHGDIGNIKFVVTFEGKIYAVDGHFSNGFFSGHIEASSGNFCGKFETSIDGKRIIIDPEEKAILMYNPTGKLLSQIGFFSDENQECADINLYTYVNGQLEGSTQLFGSRIIMSDKNDTPYLDIGYFDSWRKLGFYLNPDLMPQLRSDTYVGHMYLEGETIKLRKT